MNLSEARAQIEQVMEGLRQDVALTRLDGRELAKVNAALEQTRLRALAFLSSCCPSASKAAMLDMLEHVHAHLHAIVTSSGAGDRRLRPIAATSDSRGIVRRAGAIER